MTTSLSALPSLDGAVVVFDLDDTLYAEREFVYSAFRAIAEFVERQTGAAIGQELVRLFEQGDRDPLGAVLAQFELPIAKELLIHMYREHRPELTLAAEVRALLSDLRDSGCDLGIITDGRSATQRNKIAALGLGAWVDKIVISEEFGSSKPAERNYAHFEKCWPGRRYVYAGDNPTKDFLAPNRRGWTTVCVLDQGRNIHRQCFDRIPQAGLPRYAVDRLA